MATLEDRILGEKVENYCSSSEDEREEEDSGSESKLAIAGNGRSVETTEEDFRKWGGTASNTGPKGVIQDWREFKQIQKMEDEQKRAEALEDMKKRSFAAKCQNDADKELDELCSGLDVDLRGDPFLREYMEKQMNKMMKQLSARPRFGEALTLSDGQELLTVIEEHNDVTVIVHVFEENMEACTTMKRCIQCLAKERPFTKFCQIKAEAAGLSRRFAADGVPALLIYKGGQLLGNFIRLRDEFGEDFFATDVETFLVSHGFLNDEKLVPPSVGTSGVVDDPSDKRDSEDEDAD